MKKIKLIIPEIILGVFLMIVTLFPPFKYSYSSEGHMDNLSERYISGKHDEFRRYEPLFLNTPPNKIWVEGYGYLKKYKRDLLFEDLVAEMLLGISIYLSVYLIRRKLNVKSLS